MKQAPYHIVNIQSAENYVWGRNCKGWHLLKNEKLSVIYESMPPGTEEIMHYHNNAQQFFYILQGSASFKIENVEVRILSGDSIHISPNVKHQICNPGNVNLEFLVISQPKSHGDRVEVIND